MTTIPEISLNIETTTVRVGRRRLRATWSREAAQDLESQHNINFERELANILAREIGEEIDREIIHDLSYVIAPADRRWHLWYQPTEVDKVNWKKEGF